MSNTLSRVYRRGSRSDVRPLSLTPTRSEVAGGIREFDYPPVGQAGAAEAFPSSAEAAHPTPPSDEEVRRAAEMEHETLRKQAFQQGYADGERAGEARADARFHQATASLGEIVRSLAAYKPDLRLSAQRELVSLALTVAQRVLHREVTVDPSVVLGIVRACLDEFSAAEINRLGVHPHDYKLVSGYFQSHPVANLEIVSDPEVGPGGATFETSQGRIDARIETQLKEIEQGLADG